MSGEQLIRLRDLLAQLGISRSAVYRMMDDGKFPRPLKLSAQTIAFKQSEIDAWVESRARAGVQS